MNTDPGHYTSNGYTDNGEVPCPMPGRDDGVISYTNETGQTCWWENGHEYAKETVETPVESHWTH